LRPLSGVASPTGAAGFAYTRLVRILGIDPGSVTTGFGVIDQVRGKLTLVEQGMIRTPRGAALSSRLQIIHDAIRELIGRSVPTVAAVETPFAGLNPKSLIQLSHARGVVLLAIQSAGLEMFEYSPRSVKSAVVGYGAAEKQQVAKMVRVLLPETVRMEIGSDAADAIAIAICHANSYRLSARTLDRL